MHILVVQYQVPKKYVVQSKNLLTEKEVPKMTMDSLTPPVIASLLILLASTTAMCCDKGQNTTCVSQYYQFEEAAITNNSENIDALFSKLYRPNHPLPYSLAVLYQVQLPNGTTQRISSDPTCPSELWMWTYSPVFLLAEPSLFNRFTLYTLNYFKAWESPTVTLTIPPPCIANTLRFLSTMTMRVSWDIRNTYVHNMYVRTYYVILHIDKICMYKHISLQC